MDCLSPTPPLALCTGFEVVAPSVEQPAPWEYFAFGTAFGLLSFAIIVTAFIVGSVILDKIRKVRA